MPRLVCDTSFNTFSLSYLHQKVLKNSVMRNVFFLLKASQSFGAFNSIPQAYEHPRIHSEVSLLGQNWDIQLKVNFQPFNSSQLDFSSCLDCIRKSKLIKLILMSNIFLFHLYICKNVANFIKHFIGFILLAHLFIKI